MVYAFVDVETTGFNPSSDRIIEIAVVRYEDGQIRDTYETLVNPEIYVSSFIQEMTGIDSMALQSAPLFAEIAEEILERLEGAILVAHNVGFDHGFLKTEFRRLNCDFHPSRMCTVQLSRTLFPQHSGHGLDAVISRFGIQVNSRHRALGDTLATIKFFEKAREAVGDDRFSQVLQHLTKIAQLPPNIPAEIIEDLPTTTGVYLFYGRNGTLLYVGKSRNIRQRVKDHFYIDDPNALKFLHEVRDVDYEVTAGEIGALIRESTLIKERLPLLNKRLRRTRKLILAKEVINQEGYKTLVLEDKSGITLEEIDRIVGVYRSKKQAKEHFAEITAQFNLCDRYMGLENTRGACFGHHLKRCGGVCVGKELPEEYNARFDSAFGQYKIKAWPYAGAVAIREYNDEYDLSEVHLLDSWCYLGSAGTEEELVECLGKEKRFEHDTYKIFHAAIHKDPSVIREI